MLHRHQFSVVTPLRQRMTTGSSVILRRQLARPSPLRLNAIEAQAACSRTEYVLTVDHDDEVSVRK